MDLLKTFIIFLGLLNHLILNLYLNLGFDSRTIDLLVFIINLDVKKFYS
jgi:hypothetical protein